MNLRLFTALMLFCFIPVVTIAQISSPEENFKDTADYNIYGGPDSVFVFYYENVPVTIEGDGPGETWYDYEWWKYEPGTGYVFIDNDSVEISSIDTITGSGGYMLVTTGTGYSDTTRCWVFVNDYSVVIPNLGLVSCGLISDFRAEIDSSSFYYYQPVKDSLIRYPVTYSYTWTHDQEDEVAEPRRSGVLQAYVDEPHYEDTYYIIEVTDFSGLVRYDSVFYESIEPHAEFTAEPVPITDSIRFPTYARAYRDAPESEYPYTSAPAIYSFENLSVNADMFEWDFGDEQTDISFELTDTVEHAYLLPGSYTITLVAKKQYLLDYCTDTLVIDREEELVKLDEAGLNVSNVFKPYLGHTFRFKDVSITYFQITIYNRYGRKVHKYEGDIREWQGWDGTYMHNNNYVPNGVYYYVVKRADALPDWETGIIPDINKGTDDSTTGSDQQQDTKKQNDVYRGFIHVFNEVK